MATTVDPNSVTTTPAATPAASDSSGDSTLHGVKGSSYGSFAAATMQIATMMTTLNNMMNKNAVEQTKFGQESNETQCKATIEEGWSNAKSHMVQAGTSVATAGISAGSLALSSDPELSAQRDQAQGEVDALKAQQGPVRAGVNEEKQVIVGESSGLTNDVDEAALAFNVGDAEDGSLFGSMFDEDESGKLTDTQFKLREQVERGDFLSNNPSPEDMQAAVASTGAKAGDIDQELSRQIEHKEKVVNTLQNQISSKENNYRIKGDALKGIPEVLGQLGQAYYALQAAQEKAVGTSAQYNQGLSGQTAQAIQKTIADNWNYLSSVLNSLTQVAAAAAA